jgi:hypothetical protein
LPDDGWLGYLLERGIDSMEVATAEASLALLEPASGLVEFGAGLVFKTDRLHR